MRRKAGVYIQNIQWPLEFSVSDFYGNIFSILWRHNDVIFWKKSFFKIKSRVIYQIKGLFITNFLMNFNLSIFKPISSYWRNKWNPWWMFLSRVLLHERDRERKICTEETLYSLSLASFADMLCNINYTHAAITYPAYRRCFLTTESYLKHFAHWLQVTQTWNENILNTIYNEQLTRPNLPILLTGFILLF